MFLNRVCSWSSGTGLEIYVLNHWGVRRFPPFPNPRPPVPIDWLQKDKHPSSPIQNGNRLHVNPLKCQNHSVSPTKTKLLKPCPDTNKTFAQWIESALLIWWPYLKLHSAIDGLAGYLMSANEKFCSNNCISMRRSGCARLPRRVCVCRERWVMSQLWDGSPASRSLGRSESEQSN